MGFFDVFSLVKTIRDLPLSYYQTILSRVRRDLSARRVTKALSQISKKNAKVVNNVAYPTNGSFIMVKTGTGTGDQFGKYSTKIY